MSIKSDFTMSPPISVSGTESVVSDIGSTGATGGERTLTALTSIEAAARKHLKSNAGLVLEVPDVHEGFESSDGDVGILAGNILLMTHKYLLKRFRKLGGRMDDGVLALEAGGPGLEDFKNTLKILYTSVIEERSEFDALTLTSALRLANTYDYPALRTFAIKRLQDASLSAIERIRLAREFGLSSWEEPAYVELCDRDEAITESEAGILGLDAFVHLAKIREKEQRRRGRDVDAAMEDDDDESVPEDPYAPEGEVKPAKSAPPSNIDLPPTNSQRKRTRRSTKSAATGITSANNGRTEPQANGNQETKVKEGEKSSVLAFKDLQTQQVAHAHDITQLQTAIAQIRAPPEPSFLDITGDSMLPQSTPSESIQGDVRKWLNRGSVQSGANEAGYMHEF